MNYESTVECFQHSRFKSSAALGMLHLLTFRNVQNTNSPTWMLWETISRWVNIAFCSITCGWVPNTSNPTWLLCWPISRDVMIDLTKSTACLKFEDPILPESSRRNITSFEQPGNQLLKIRGDFKTFMLQRLQPCTLLCIDKNANFGCISSISSATCGN